MKKLVYTASTMSAVLTLASAAHAADAPWPTAEEVRVSYCQWVYVDLQDIKKQRKYWNGSRHMAEFFAMNALAQDGDDHYCAGLEKPVPWLKDIMQ